MFTCTIPGTPQQQGSKTVYHRRTVDSNKNLAPWRADAIWYLRRAMQQQMVVQYTGPVLVRATFMYRRPAAHYGTGRNALILKPSAPTFKASAPDLDKLQRALGDALTQAGVLRDDCLIVGWHTRKLWGEAGEVQLSIEKVA